MTAHDPATNVIRSEEDIGAISATFAAVLRGSLGYEGHPGDWSLTRSECGTTITFTDIALQRALTGTPVPQDEIDRYMAAGKAVIDANLDAPVQPEQPGRIITADEVQPGDKIEITFALAIVDGEWGNLAIGEVGQDRLGKLAGLNSATTIRLIERPEKPIAVGDRVYDATMDWDDSGAYGTVRHVEDGWASVKWDGQPGLGVSELRYLTRPPVSPSA